MPNLLQEFEQKQLSNLMAEKKFPSFQVGDTVSVHLKISEGSTERIQVYEGLCIAMSRTGLSENFTVRKISYNEGIERTFQLCSPKIADIKVVRRNKVRRAKLYYMRELRGKAARLKARP